MGRVWDEGSGDTRAATGCTAAPSGPSKSSGTAGDVTSKSQGNDAPAWSHSSAAVVCFSQ